MPDRAYIISRTLEDKIAIAENIGQNTMIVTLDVLKEIFSLLKEHEPVEPLRVNTTFEQYWRCGFCGAIISPHDKYCHECGREQKWE